MHIRIVVNYVRLFFSLLYFLVAIFSVFAAKIQASKGNVVLIFVDLLIGFLAARKSLVLLCDGKVEIKER